MSNLIDMLEKIGDSTPGPMGFGPATGQSKSTTQMVLVVRISPDMLSNQSVIEKLESNAILVDTTVEEFLKITKPIDTKPHGLHCTKVTASGASTLIDSCCDFVILESLQSEAAVTNIDDLGIVVTIDNDMEKETIRSLGMLPIGAVLLRPPLVDLPLRLDDAINIQKLARLIGKPMLVETPNGVDEQGIEVLRNIGVQGLIMDFVNVQDLEKIKETNEAISNLKKIEPKAARRNVYLPQLTVKDKLYPDDAEDI
jgi:hypothetical protein